MSLQKKYYYTFKGLDNTSFLVEIWQETTSTITAEEITGDADPFNIEYPTTGIFEPVKGSGCTLNLLSTTDRKFLSLYTADMMEYQIRLYKSGILYWVGYLDSELYSEPFNELTNYTVTFTGSDGFALLERLNYLNTDGLKYSGLTTQWQVLQNIINKLNLPFKNIYIGLSTTSSNFTIASNETIFHKTYCNNQNWYNEDGDPETARKVLECILQPYAAYIIQDNANLYITDINTVAGAADASFKKYSNSFSYIDTVFVNLNLGDLSVIKFAASNQQLNVVAGYNRQVVKYSPYTESALIELNAEKELTDKAFTGNLYNTVHHGTFGYYWNENFYYNSTNWYAYPVNNGFFCSSEGLDGDNVGDKEYYFNILSRPLTGIAMNEYDQTSNPTFTYKKELPVLIGSDYFLKIKMSAFVRTSDDMKNVNNVASEISNCILQTKLTIGNKEWHNPIYLGTSGYWTEPAGESFYIDFNKKSNPKATSYTVNPIENSWIDFTISKQTPDGTGGYKFNEIDYLIPLNDSSLNGQLVFNIYNYRCYDMDLEEKTVLNVRLKDIAISVCDSKGNEIDDSDSEYIGYMNTRYKNEGDEITLYQGTSKLLNGLEKGALICNTNGNYTFINNWTREGKTDCIENLLLRSIVSNYTNKRIELTATVNKIDSILGCLKYQSSLPNKNLMIVGCTQNLSDSTTSLTLQEVIKDNLEINKSW